MVDREKPGDSGKWFRFSRNRCFVLILIFTGMFLIYNIKIKEMAPDWNPKMWIQNQSADLWNLFRSQRQNASSAHPAANDSSTALLQTDNKTSAPEVNTETQNKTVPTTAVAYVSPAGSYLVEYPSDYHFIINEPQKCEKEKPFVVLMVPVAPNNRQHRDIIRNTWGSESPVLDKGVKLFFLLGLHTGTGEEQVQQQVLQESKEHHDLIQSNFVDCYKNLTIKTMVMLEWLTAHCSSASYAMKIDSDMFLNVHNLVSMLLKANKTNYMTGRVERGATVRRDPNSKWYLPPDIYAPSQYPRYALGLGYVLSLDLPKKLTEASRHVKAVYIEDVYLGLLMQHLGIPPTDPPSWDYFLLIPLVYNRCRFSMIVATTTHPNTDREQIWRDFKKPGPFCYSKKNVT
ncbi:beta-1,3-galactosyltransferase 1-like [Archocentrus centrarchus]|uniref:beta-1,3-galactosyltransferase 1-like n=1 Tax=Archocentrus centrarchus TaxID=63155 RepID=UPI0011E9D4B2|nr:beta-1,3-galactosyltransferase 1-like [Archocentrus centrarchus]